MELPDYALARMYITETRIGRRMRAAVRRENEQAQEAVDAIRKQER